jgi:hypothetical protein
MNQKLDLNDQNKVTVMLVQSLWGAISPNFRMVALALAEPIWQLLFVLENECAADREEIEDVAGEFDALLLGLNSGSVKFDVRIVVSVEPLPALDPSSWRVVFRRREI